jgi:hypothetical protein
MASSRTPVTCTAEDVGDKVYVQCTRRTMWRLGLTQRVAEIEARVNPKTCDQKWHTATVTWWKLRSGGGVTRPFDADDVEVTQEAVTTLLDALREKNVGIVEYDALPGEVDLMRRRGFHKGAVRIDDRREKKDRDQL